MPDLNTSTLGVIGAGNMAEALVRGVLSAGLIDASRVTAADPSETRRAVFAALGVSVTEENAAAAACDIVLLSVKPQVFDEVVGAAGAGMSADTLAVSIAAGVRSDRIARLLPEGVRIVRVMPNTPMLAGAGVAGVARGPHATDRDMAAVLSLFRSAGEALTVDEALLDAVTAVSGSGPAYVFRFVEALAAAGVEAGLLEDEAMILARQTVVGAAKLLDQSDETAAVLRERVTSPGGTTAAALASFTESDLESVVAKAVCAARDRSVELAGG